MDIPYKTYLTESEVPEAWYNVRADMKVKPSPLLNPCTLKPVTAEEASHIHVLRISRPYGVSQNSTSTRSSLTER